MCLVKPWLEQRQDFSDIDERMQVGSHDRGTIVRPGRGKLDCGGGQATSDDLPFARQHKHDGRG